MSRWLVGSLLAALVATPTLPAANRPLPISADLSVRIEPDTRELSGTGVWIIPQGAPLRITLDERFSVRRLDVDGEPIATIATTQNGHRYWTLTNESRDPRRVEIEWAGRLDPLDAGLDHRTVLQNGAAVTGSLGTFLPGSAVWHPLFAGDGLRYRLRIDVPQAEYAIAAGDLVEHLMEDGRRKQTYAFEQPGTAIDLMSGPYRVSERSFASTDGRRISLRTLFHEEIADLADPYLDSTARFLTMYEREIGAYPYRSFSIVSSPTPTGFGMPTMTYLGIHVLRLPFIRDTSLGHEVLHNWWGNGVYPDLAGGNWSEGLTTFMADYAYREQAGPEASREMRMAWLRDIAALGTGQDRPLIEFTSRKHGVEQIVGYHKSAMLFVMLRDAIGNDAFDEGLQRFWREHRFSVASWDDLRAAFEAASSRELSSFFSQWLTRTGAPDLRLEEAAAFADGANWRVDFTLRQDRPAYRLRVPVALEIGAEVETHWVEMQGEDDSFSIHTAGSPSSIALDPDARVLRLLAPGEAPPILRQAMLNPATVVVLASGAEQGARLARSLLEHPLQLLSPAQAVPTDPLLLVGMREDVQRYLARHGLGTRPAELDVLPERATAWVWTLSRAAGGELTVVSARDPEALVALERPLPHYGRQSWLVFEGRSVVARGAWASRPQRIRFGDTDSADRK